MVKRPNKINIRDIFLGLQRQMKSKLSFNKKILTHPVAKGDASEAEWINMLASYLPNRYRADRAFVIDYEGNVSDQIDIVIYDRHYSPFLLKQDGSTYIPAESVYAVIEVKPTLNKKNNLDKAKKDDFLHFGCSLQDGSFWFKKCRGNKYSFERSAKKRNL